MKWTAFAPVGAENLGQGYFDVVAPNRAAAEVLIKMPNNNSVVSILNQKLGALSHPPDGENLFTVDKIDGPAQNGTFRALITVYVQKSK